MKIFILNPNFNLEKKSLMNVRIRQPLSLAIIAAILRQLNHEIKFLDANVLNLPESKIIKNIKKYEPEILILTSTPVDRWECPNSYIDHVFKIINQLDLKYKILIGSHGTVQPEWIFKNCNIDFIIRGEPELVVKNLIQTITQDRNFKSILGLSWRQGNKIIHNPSAERITNLNELPLPAYDLLPMYRYCSPGFRQPFSIMFTSRGCPFNCTFCLKAMLPERHITQLPESIIKEIEHLINNFNIRSIYFQDWEFLIEPKRVAKICQLIIDKDLIFDWGCNARADDIVRNQELISLMKKSGCIKINIGLESGSDEILNNINKKLNQQDLQNAIDILKQNNIEFGHYVLLNCPGENRETIQKTIDFIIKNNLKVKKFNLVIPYPGTQLFGELKQIYPNKNFNWANIESYAGRIKTEINPHKALFYLRHYKFQKQYGKLYFLNPKFWKKILY